VSNFDVEDLEEAKAIAGVPACNQVLYHVAERAIEHEVLPWCLTHRVALVAYTPFGKSASVYQRTTAGGRVLHEIAAAHGATARQVALQFLLRSPAVFVIPKAAQLEHVSENAGAAHFTLSAPEISAIERAYPRGTRRELPTD
jgi:diketogulonate reductase-like aldo/keto reductase